jgi:hypothetical protein
MQSFGQQLHAPMNCTRFLCLTSLHDPIAKIKTRQMTVANCVQTLNHPLAQLDLQHCANSSLTFPFVC